MKVFVKLLVLFALVAVSLSAVSVGIFNNPKHPGKCAISDDLILEPGEHKDPNQDCGLIICSSDGQAQFQTCSIEQLTPDCTFTDYVDLSRNYPDCCQKNIECFN